jgi:hypothetical protein
MGMLATEVPELLAGAMVEMQEMAQEAWAEADSADSVEMVDMGPLVAEWEVMVQTGVVVEETVPLLVVAETVEIAMVFWQLQWEATGGLVNKTTVVTEDPVTLVAAELEETE